MYRSAVILNIVLSNNVLFFFSFRMGALHQAALVGNTTIMRLLLESSAAVDLEDNKGYSNLLFLFY